MREGLDDQGTYFQIHEVENTTPIVFIHGVGLSHEIWNPQIEFFKKQTTITYDLFCHGRSTCTFNEIGFEDFSNQINELLLFLKLQKAILVGFSLGGLIAAHFASTYTKKIEKLILFGTIYGRTDEEQTAAMKRFEGMDQLKREDPTLYYKMLLSEGVDPNRNMNIPVRLEFEMQNPEFGTPLSSHIKSQSYLHVAG